MQLYVTKILRFHPKKTSKKDQAEVAELDAYLEDTQNGGHHTDTALGGYRVAL